MKKRTAKQRKKIIHSIIVGISVLFISVFIAFLVLFIILPLPGTVPVLMYHFVGSERDAKDNSNYVSARMFANQMAFLKRFGYRVLSLAEYEDTLTGKRKPRGREVVITFDDGHYTFADQALPILDRYQFPVNLFLISEFVKGHIKCGSMEKDTLDNTLLTRPWIHVNSHTRTAPELPSLSEAEILAELSGSKADLEAMFRVPVNYLAYPSGEFDERVIQAARQAGYHLAFTTAPKKLKKIPLGPYSLTRDKIFRESENPFVFWSHVSGLYQWFKESRHLAKQKERETGLA